MNYLAHAYLSNNNKDLLIGNFIADHLRGNNFSNYPPAIIEGIILHRKIDAFTDSHALFKASKRLFYNGFEKYSGVLVDIYFDHLLAKNFNRFSLIPLRAFAQNVYRIYLSCQQTLPESSAGFLDYVLKNDIYTTYASLKGIERVLFQLSGRIRHGIQLNESLQLFIKNEKALEDNFTIFFQEAIAEFHVTP